MSNDKVISLVNAASDLDEPEQMLRKVLEELEPGGKLHGRRKMLVISVDDSDSNYDVSWRHTGMRCSEMLGMLDIVASTFRKEMGY